jgi:hypothetical protein
MDVANGDIAILRDIAMMIFYSRQTKKEGVFLEVFSGATPP